MAVFLLAYLLGAIPFGLLVARWFGISDIRSHGSGNIGATNVWRVAGPRAAIWVYILDIGKGVAAVLIARAVSQTWLPRDTFLVLTALAAVLGHVFPVYMRFKGGKGVNTGLGVIATLLPLEALICFLIFVIVVALSRYISLGSIVGSISLASLVGIERQLLGRQIAVIYLYLTIALAVLVILTHWKNIGRILQGTESRFSFSGGSKERPRG
ncbi:acyl-phosphate glycerol 3-phosphate acyltransferase [candidate division GN15 bacterium]|uniref:Glycerol-3-phosphate acyltransferase n=1 Tax=candidate division GN15 bacterium TaxID=2072418 RepID=A0A855X674_9BACT|nr:MAG: acyl-phosphate glycerol 3-phosphate acyltransferase [candidate division GN15 bacterium]